MNKEKELYDKIDYLQDELLTALNETIQLLTDRQNLLEENKAIKAVIIEVLNELMPDKVYGYVHESIYESIGSAGLSRDKEAYEGSGTHIPVFKFPMSILKLRGVIKNG